MAKLILTPTDLRAHSVSPALLDSELKTRFDIGRGHTGDFVLPDHEAVSRLHCLIEYIDDQWLLTDVSRNGTFLNGDRLTPNRRTLVLGLSDKVYCSAEVGFVIEAATEDEEIDIEVPEPDNKPTRNLTIEKALENQRKQLEEIKKLQNSSSDSLIDDARQWVSELNNTPLIRVVLYGIIGLLLAFIIWGCAASGAQ